VTETRASSKRENALGKIISRFDGRDKQEERFLNGYAHHTVPPIASAMQQMEEDINQKVQHVEGTIYAIVCAECCEKSNCQHVKDAQKLLNSTIRLPNLFPLTWTYRGWIEKFYLQSTSINAKALEIQQAVGEAGFAQPAMTGFQPWGSEEEAPESD